MRRLIWGFAGHTYHIAGNLMLRLKWHCLLFKASTLPHFDIYEDKKFHAHVKKSMKRLCKLWAWPVFFKIYGNVVSLYIALLFEKALMLMFLNRFPHRYWRSKKFMSKLIWLTCYNYTALSCIPQNFPFEFNNISIILLTHKLPSRICSTSL